MLSVSLKPRSFYLVSRYLRSLTGIYAVLDSAVTDDLPRLLDDVLRVGVRIVQYRAKDGIDRGILRRMLARAHAEHAVIIVNDDPEAALAADGLHVGQEDLTALHSRTLRRRLGRRILGISCSTPEEARQAERIGADYLGVGPFRGTASKADAGTAIGVPGVRRVVEATRLPVAAIGGIGIADLEAVIGSGARMAAVISAIASPMEGDAESAARALVQRWMTLKG